MSRATVYLAVPVYRGVELVAETLRSVRDQTFGDYRVAISVDADDRASAAVCEPFLADPRVRMTVQDRRLGWPGNLNWLARRCDCPYFCYWQQDDLAATNYLERLHEELVRFPAAALVFADVQWFGHRYHRDAAAGVFGTPAERVRQVAEGLHYEPLRGLMRSAWLPQGDFMTEMAEEGCHEEFATLARLAARGDFRRVADTMYFKRAHSASTHGRWSAWDEPRRRRAWLTLGRGLLQVAAETVADRGERDRLGAQILDRLVTARPGRGFFHHPPPGTGGRFVHDLLLGRDPLAPRPENVATVEPVAPEVRQALTDRHLDAGRRRAWAERLVAAGAACLTAAELAELGALGAGWAPPEHWGVWTVGPAAELCLPLPPGRWTVTLSGRHFAAPDRPAGDRCRIPWRHGHDAGTASVPCHEEAEWSVSWQAGADALVLTMFLPDATAPAACSASPDERHLGWGLHAVRVAACPHPVPSRSGSDLEEPAPRAGRDEGNRAGAAGGRDDGNAEFLLTPGEGGPGPDEGSCRRSGREEPSP